jgi:hypothetical protein
MNPRILLRLEGAIVLLLSLFIFNWNHGSWLSFALLFLVPDLSMIGYLGGVRLGAVSYNLIHTYVGPLVLSGISIWTAHHTPFDVSLIWLAHLGFDRMLGFGLKYPTRFQDTTLNPARHALDIGR